MRSLRLFHFDIPTWGNFGDKALFPVVRDAFRVLGGTDGVSGEPNFTFASAAALRREVDEAAVARINATADAVVIGGGGLFLQDTNPNRLSGWQWKISTEALGALEVPLIVYALGDNRFPGQPEFDDLMRSHVSQVLDQSAFFGLRNTGSMSTIGALLGRQDRIAFQPCPTTILDHLYAPLAGRRPDPKQKTVAIQMLVHPRQIAAGFDADTIHEATVRAARILVAQGWRVLSTPFHPDDAQVSRRIVAEVAGVEAVRLYGHDVGFFSGVEFFSSVPYVLGGRGHAQMIPFGVGSIPISVDLHAKLGYFATDIGHPEFVVPVGADGMSADAAEAAHSDGDRFEAAEGVSSDGDRVEAADALADRMVAALEDAYSRGPDLQVDLAETRARFADITADNLEGISDSVCSHVGAGSVGSPMAGSGELPDTDSSDPPSDDGPQRGTAIERRTGESRLRLAEDILAEEFHVAAIAESEEVAAQQTRALARADRELIRSRRDHDRTMGEIQARTETRLNALESERDDALAEAERQRSESEERDKRIAQLSDEAARNARDLEAANSRTAREEARVLADKVRHGIRWRLRRLKRHFRR
ncbi:Polysaccharide pyruvyl transferase family protein WcaK [Brevibacterium siliguriense]|uniref:Polysaccharide pyruvyl transferase family protein WcaK n=1 Tax=Brevibacterium siliguriense TaxID=1136497 RepID=A0A1H1QTB1_9MICO|nr:polysaccharide pyruvyl transferase family protein [Brevibacterium siliguriense]SDS26645.1 Polysaccharide pyruvyl transferase family protein WcaK [Brevibacterium siliguriense]